jgi:hypothetical protein
MTFKFFDLQPLVAYNALLNFIISNRGAGKTYSGKQHVIRRFQKKDELFLFLKRTETEIEATADSFWDDVQTDKQVFKFVKNKFYIGDRSVDKDEEGNDVEEITWKLLGYAAALSTTSKLKGISPQNVKTIIWDEFIPYDGRYLRDEGIRLLDVMETIGRMNEDVRLYAFGNKNEDGYYPVLHDLGVTKASDYEDNKIYRFKNGEILVYSFTNKEYVKAKSKTKLGKVARGTSYFEKMIENKNQSDFSDLVIGGRPKRFTPLFSIAIRGEYYLVGFMYVAKQTGIYIEQNDKPHKKLYTCDNTTPTLPKLAGNGVNMLYGYIVSGLARFDNQVSAQRTIEAIISKRRA